eukprot:7946042-Pyramimonas_sp.AAC.1
MAASLPLASIQCSCRVIFWHHAHGPCTRYSGLRATAANYFALCPRTLSPLAGSVLRAAEQKNNLSN